MQPSLPIPTDNIYKFSCLFGLVLIVSSIFAFAAAYNASLDRKVKYAEVIIPLNEKSDKTKVDEELLSFNNRLLAIAGVNERVASITIGSILAIGIWLSFYGATKWMQIIQKRDDELANLQLESARLLVEKSKIEIIKLKADLSDKP